MMGRPSGKRTRKGRGVSAEADASFPPTDAPKFSKKHEKEDSNHKYRNEYTKQRQKSREEQKAQQPSTADNDNSSTAAPRILIAEGKENVLAMWMTLSKSQKTKILDVQAEEVQRLLDHAGLLSGSGVKPKAKIESFLDDADSMTSLRLKFVTAVMDLSGEISEEISNPIEMAVLGVLERHLLMENFFRMIEGYMSWLGIFLLWRFYLRGQGGRWQLLLSILFTPAISVVCTFSYEWLVVARNWSISRSFPDSDPELAYLAAMEFFQALTTVIFSTSANFTWHPEVICIFPVVASSSLRLLSDNETPELRKLRAVLGRAVNMLMLIVAFFGDKGWSTFIGTSLIFHFDVIAFVGMVTLGIAAFASLNAVKLVESIRAVRHAQGVCWLIFGLTFLRPIIERRVPSMWAVLFGLAACTIALPAYVTSTVCYSLAALWTFLLIAATALRIGWSLLDTAPHLLFNLIKVVVCSKRHSN